MNTTSRFVPSQQLRLPLEPAFRSRCYDCFRPAGDCFCDAIPAVDNQTEVLILQHMRERFHPFNTARIVNLALRNSSLLVDHTARLAQRLSLKLGAALLYPGDNVPLLVDLPAGNRPKQLVILDGTWHHAKTLIRDIPALQRLPRYALAPGSPSRYRIRREPQAAFLSTVEATVAALRVLEPATVGLDSLLQAFDQMVERQLGHPKSEQVRKHIGRRKRTVRNIPQALGDLDNLVVAYGESAPAQRDCWHLSRQPVYWVAERLLTGERFGVFIRPGFELSETYLAHLELASEDFAGAQSLREARAAWSAFLQPGDTVAVYNQGTARLYHQLSSTAGQCIVLKSVDFHPGRRYQSLDELLAAEGQMPEPAKQHGRAERRLAQVIAFARFLNALGAASAATSRRGPPSSP